MPLNPPKRFTAADIIIGTDWQKTSPTLSAGTGKYTEIPTLARWKKDSVGASPSREQLLTRIDALVEDIDQAPDAGAKTYLVAVLYFVLVEYLGPTDSKKQKPAAENLLLIVALKLSDAFNCAVNTLPRELERWFGRGLSFHGYKTDTGEGGAHYLSRAKAERQMLHFRDGKLWQLRCRCQWIGKLGGMVLADSKRDANPEIFGRGGWDHKDWSGFVLGMDGNLYMAHHHSGFVGRYDGMFHSSYTGGNHVRSAGSLRIKKGVLLAIRVDSGHYQPDALSMISVLEKCVAHGIDISRIEIQAYRGTLLTYGGDYLRAHGNLDALRTLRQINIKFIATEHHEKNQYDNVITDLWEEAQRKGTCTPDREGRRHFAKTILWNRSAGGDNYTHRYLTEEYIFSVLTHGSDAPLNPDAELVFTEWIAYMSAFGVHDTWNDRCYFADDFVARRPEMALQKKTVLRWLNEAYASKNLPTDTPATGRLPSGLRRSPRVADLTVGRALPPVPGSSVPTMPPPPPPRSSVPTMPPPPPPRRTGSPPPPPGRMPPPPPPGRPGRATVARRSTLRPPEITRF